MEKKFYVCTVCGDVHYGGKPPQTCPTCKTEDAYEEISKEKAEEKMDL